MKVALGTVGDFKGVEEEAEGRDLVEEDFRGNTERWIGDVIVEDEGISAVVGGGCAGSCGLGAVGRKLGADGDVVCIVIVDASTDDEIARKKVDGCFVVVFGEGWNAGEGCG